MFKGSEPYRVILLGLSFSLIVGGMSIASSYFLKANNPQLSGLFDIGKLAVAYGAGALQNRAKKDGDNQEP
jgi:hypothetical protein